jgi:hypothetical protein
MTEADENIVVIYKIEYWIIADKLLKIKVKQYM